MNGKHIKSHSKPQGKKAALLGRRKKRGAV